MKILISNDDGVFSPGIRTLYNELKDIADVTVVAPLQERSATGQTLTLDHPLRVEKVDDNIYGTTGFPADCVLLGILHILKQKPDLVISGINRGANLGQDIYYSGTVAAARQAVFHNVPGIALSTVIDETNDSIIHYDSGAKYIKNFLTNGLHRNLCKDEILNINFPNLPSSKILGAVMTELAPRIYSEELECRQDSRGKEYFWIGGRLLGHGGGPGSDSYAIENNRISINLLNLYGQPVDITSKWSELIG